MSKEDILNTKPFYNSSIPSDWEVKELHSCSEFITKGATPTTYGFSWVKEGIIFLRSECVSERGLELGAAMFISEEADKAMKRSSLQDEDILMTITGNVGRVCKVPIGFPKANINQHIARIRIKNSLYELDFIFQYLKQDKISKEYLKITTGQAYPQISLEQVRGTQIPLPPLPEQKAIAHILSLMDTAINKNNLLIAKKELQKKWLMQNLLTGKKRLKGFGEEWREEVMSNMFDRVTRKNTEGNTTVVTISAQRGFVRQTDFFNKNIASEITENYFLVHRGEFCYNKSYSNGYPWGATKRLNDFDKAVVTTLYICFGITDENKTDGNFFEQYFEANLLDNGLTKIAHEGGRAHGLLNVTPSDFLSLKITIPNKEEQTAIAQVLQAADKEIQLLKVKTEKLREMKKGLMQVLLTGKVRVKIMNDEL